MRQVHDHCRKIDAGKTMNSSKLNIPLCEPSIDKAELESVTKCIQSGFVSSVGPLIGEFEKAFAEFTGSEFAVATSSGTAAIHTALKALNTGPQDLVAVSDLTFVASVNPVLYCGASCCLCDSEYNSWCMDPVVLERLIYQKMKRGRQVSAIIPVHLFGRHCAMDRICAVAEKYNIPVIEDATESLGATLHGRHAGTWGTMGCYSFNGNKLITTGAGGMVVTNSRKTAERVRFLVNQARADSARFIHSEAGFNYRMSNVAAALGLAQLGRIREFIARKKEIAAAYERAFADIPEIETASIQPGEDPCFWLYSITVSTPQIREHIINTLVTSGVQARRFFEPLHTQPYLRQKLWIRTRSSTRQAATGLADQLAATGINLPCSVNLSRSHQADIITLVRSCLAHRRLSQPDISLWPPAAPMQRTA